MKLKFLFMTLLLYAAGLFFPAFAQDWVSKLNDPTVNFFETQDAFYQYYNEYRAKYRAANGTDPARVPGYKQFKRWEAFMEPRVYDNGMRFDPSRVWQESQQYKQQMALTSAGNWTHIGPNTVPSSGGGAGRLNFVRIDPANPDNIFVGSPAGGLWKSTDGGLSWNTNTDWLAQVIGCTDLAIDPTNSDIMYLATGDGDAGDTYSVGVLKTTDGGTTWNTTGLSFYTANYRQMNKILINPNNTNIILVATSAGVYKSNDAGATFTLTQTNGFKDMEFKPGDPNTVYVCGTEFYKSTDGGDSFTKITSGVPNALDVSRMAIAVTPANPDYIYMIVGLPAPDYGTEGFYRSSNSGNSFSYQSAPDIGNQQWYDLAIAASPSNANEVLIGGQADFLRSTNGGVSWAQNGFGTHVDYHDVIYTSATECYMANDGGIYKTTNNGNSWTNLSNGLAISQMYGFGQSATSPDLLIQGWQDNGTNRYNGLSWTQVIGADGMLCFIDYSNNQNMWGSTQNGGLRRSTNGGGNFSSTVGNINETGAWVTPWLQDPVTPGTIYAGFGNVWKSTTGGGNWTKISNFNAGTTINVLAVSPANNQVIYAAKASGLSMTNNGGSTWTTFSNIPTGTITGIACSNTDPNKAWITYSGFNNTSKVFQTNDQGVTWINISSSIPNIPVNCIVYVNNSNDGIYIGTDMGVFYKDATLNVWQPFFNGLPNVIVTQLAIFYPTGLLRASTYGRGMWESTLYVPGSYAPSAAFGVDNNFACPGALVQYTDFSAGSPTSWSWSFPGGSPSSSTQQNPSVVYNVPGTYAATLTATNANGTSDITYSGLINVTPSTFSNPSTVSAQRCGPGVVNLSASGSGQGNLRWWDAPGGGNIVNLGPTYSPSITGTTTFWVDEDFPYGSQDFTGEYNNSFGTGAFFTANDIRGLYFDVLQPVILNTVDVFPNSSGNRTIEVLDEQGNTVIDTTLFIPSSPNNAVTIDLNFVLYPGNNYFIKCRGNVDLYRNATGAVYPYPSSRVNITGSNAGSPGYYYFFYNWTYTEVVCNTGRTAVIGEDTCTVGLPEALISYLSVYPNPGNGMIEIGFTGSRDGIYEIAVSNTLGQNVFRKEMQYNAGVHRQKFDLSHLAKGVYNLNLLTGGEVVTKKFVIE